LIGVILYLSYSLFENYFPVMGKKKRLQAKGREEGCARNAPMGVAVLLLTFGF